MINLKEYHKNDIDVTDQLGENSNSDWYDGSFINPKTGILTIYNEGGHNSTTCDIRELIAVIKNNPKLVHLLKIDSVDPLDNKCRKCSNCKFWTNEADPCEWWSGKYFDDWKNAKFCSKSDYNTNNVGDITATAISKEGYVAGLMTKPEHSCDMFESKKTDQ